MGPNITALSSTNATLGWQPGCTTRGTWDIIWSCLQTTALCAWVSASVNIPAQHEDREVDIPAEDRDRDRNRGKLALYVDKFFFTLLTLLGPELVFLLAYGQYQSAVTSRELFHKSGYLDWSLTHAFYADMGGIHVRPSGWKRFPVNAKQLHYLVTHGYMDYPKITEKEILARGKIDGLARLITLVQAFGFIISIIARFVTGLAVTTMEVTVLANIFVTLATFVVWWQKPTDVEIGHLYELQTTIDTILKEAGPDADGQYKDTPLDFASREEWYGSLIWNYNVNILRRMGISNLTYEKPKPRISTFNFPKLRSQPQRLFILVLGLAYFSFFIGSWNFHFPSNTERILWRTSIVAQTIIAIIANLFEIITFEDPAATSQAIHRQRTSEGEKTRSFLEKGISSLRELWNRPCNNELTGDFPCMNLPFRSILLTTSCCAAYVVCRWCILAEDVVSLRSLPASAFLKVEWTPYWPWL